MFIVNTFKARQTATSLGVSLLVGALTSLFLASPAQAECIYEGQAYQTGDTVGPLICMPDGTWQQQ